MHEQPEGSCHETEAGMRHWVGEPRTRLGVVCTSITYAVSGVKWRIRGGGWVIDVEHKATRE